MIVHSKFDGVLEGVSLSHKLNSLIKRKVEYIDLGDDVNAFTGANTAIAILLMESNDDVLSDVITNYDENVMVKVEYEN